MELTSFGQFSSIDENAILFHSPPTFENGSKMLRNSNRNKSPALSDLNPAPPISLPDLRPVSHKFPFPTVSCIFYVKTHVPGLK